MLSKEMNERLTRVGPGTPLGNLLRRYWYPVARVADLDEEPVLAVGLLGLPDREEQIGRLVGAQGVETPVVVVRRPRVPMSRDRRPWLLDCVPHEKTPGRKR